MILDSLPEMPDFRGAGPPQPELLAGILQEGAPLRAVIGALQEEMLQVQQSLLNADVITEEGRLQFLHNQAYVRAGYSILGRLISLCTEEQV